MVGYSFGCWVAACTADENEPVGVQGKFIPQRTAIVDGDHVRDTVPCVTRYPGARDGRVEHGLLAALGEVVKRRLYCVERFRLFYGSIHFKLSHTYVYPRLPKALFGAANLGRPPVSRLQALRWVRLR